MKRVRIISCMQARLLALECTLCILQTLNAFAQNAIVGDGFGTGWGGTCGSNSNFIYFTQGAGSSYTSGIVSPTGTGNKYWRFGVDWGGTIKQLHTNNTGVDEIISPNATYTLDASCVSNGAMYLNVSNASYNYILKTKDAGANPSNQFVVFEVQGPVQTINTVSQFPLATSVTAGQPVNVTANLSGTLPAGQAVYLRYSTVSNFSSSAVVTMSGSGATFTATIPQTINVSGSSVYYYLFTSGIANVQANGSNADFYAINLNNNGNANYSYTVNTSSIIYNYTNNATGNFNSIGSNLSAGNLTRVNGAASPGTPCASGFSVSNFSTATSFSSSLAAIEINLTPSPGFILWVNSISADLRRSNSGPVATRMAYSNDGGITWMNTGTDWAPNNGVCNSITSYAWNPATFNANEINGLKIRLYGFNASSTIGILQILNLKVSGTVIAADCYNPVTALTVTNNCFTTATIQWTAPLSYNTTNNTTLVFARQGSPIITGTPSLGAGMYNASSSFGAGTTYENDAAAFCIYKGDGASINLSGLTPGSDYYLLAYNVLDPQAYSSSSATSFTTITNPGNIVAPSVSAGNGQLIISWSNPVACFDEIMIIATDNPSVISTPVGDGSLYTANAVYNDGNNSVNPGSNEYCIYRGTSSTVTMNGLVNGTTYNIKIFARKDANWSPGVAISGMPVTIFSGSFRSKQNGNWTSASTWQQFSGGVWVAATTFPNSSTSDVTIQAGHTVMVDGPGPYALKNLAISATGKLYSNNTSATTNIYLTVFGNITCNGVSGNAPLNDNLAFNIDGSSCTISGTGTFTASRIRKYYNVNAVTALAIDMNVTTQWAASAAIYNGNTNTTAFNIVINAGRTVTVLNGGNVSIHGTSGAGFNNSYGTYTINGILAVSGTLILVNSNSNSLYPSTINIGATGIINTSSINAAASGLAGSKFSIASGGLLNITGTSAFTSFSNTNNTYTINSGSTIQYSAAGAQTVEASFSYSNLIISGSGIKYANNNIAVAKTFLLAGGSFSQTGFTTTISPGGTLTGNGGDFASGVAGGILRFSGNGTISGTTAIHFYHLNIQSGTVTSTLTNCAAASLNLAGGIFQIGSSNQFNILTGGSVNSMAGDFANGLQGGILNFNGSGSFTGNCNPYHVYTSGGVNFGSGIVSIQNGGSFVINSSGYADINGPFYTAGSTLIYNCGGVFNRSVEWNQATPLDRGYPHHVMVRNGTDLNLGTNTPAILEMGGNLVIGTSTSSNNKVFMNSLSQPLKINGDLIIGDNASSGNELVLSSQPGGDLELFGNFTKYTANNYFTHSNRSVIFKGGGHTTINGDAQNFYNIILQKTPPGDITLNCPVTIEEVAEFTSGKINSSATNMLVFDQDGSITGNPSASSYINGPATKLYNSLGDEFIFPIGKENAMPVYNPCGISPATINSSTGFTAEYFKDPLEQQTVMSGFVMGITNKGYWEITCSNNSSVARVKLFYSNPGPGQWIYYDGTANSAPYYYGISDPCATCNVAVVNREGSTNTWKLTNDSSRFNTSIPEYRYYLDSGFIYSAPLTSFTSFSIGFAYNVILLLPVKLLSFGGQLSGTNALLNWKVDDVKNLAGFELQYSRDGKDLSALSVIRPGLSKDYSFIQKSISAGNHFYRLLVRENNGNFFLSEVIMLATGYSKTTITGLTNNPVRDKITTVIHSASSQMATAMITDISGRLITLQHIQLIQGQNEWQIRMDYHFAPGIYFIRILTGDGVTAVIKFMH